MLVLASLSTSVLSNQTTDKTSIRIAFGSCADEMRMQPIWSSIAIVKPDLFIFTGDAIYADYDGKSVIPVSAASLRNSWKKLGDEPHFARFRNKVKIVGTWDNHDYGSHNRGISFSLKEESKTAFLDFFAEPKNSPRRKRAGIYASELLNRNGHVVQILLLDTRSFKDDILSDQRSKEERSSLGLSGTLGMYPPTDDRSSSLLGEAQWQWLEESLNVPAEVRLLVSSTQIIPDQKHMDEWGNYPHERKRLFRLLTDSRASGVILLSGNVHFAELSMLERSNTYPLLEMTSSGLTHTNSAYAQVPNPYRIGTPFDHLNFGVVEIHWQAMAEPTIRLAIYDKSGKVQLEHQLPLTDLQSSKTSVVPAHALR